MTYPPEAAQFGQPRVLSLEEVGRLLEAAPAPGLKYKAALSVAYRACTESWWARGDKVGIDH